MAPRNTLPSTLLKSGFNRNSMPAPAPGRDMEQMARIINRTNSIGIMILADFSIPFPPFDNDEMGGQQNSTSQMTGRQGVADKAVEG